MHRVGNRRNQQPDGCRSQGDENAKGAEAEAEGKRQTHQDQGLNQKDQHVSERPSQQQRQPADRGHPEPTTPKRSSEIRLKPTPAAPNSPSWIGRPGTNAL